MNSVRGDIIHSDTGMVSYQGSLAPRPKEPGEHQDDQVVPTTVCKLFGHLQLLSLAPTVAEKDHSILDISNLDMICNVIAKLVTRVRSSPSIEIIKKFHRLVKQLTLCCLTRCCKKRWTAAAFCLVSFPNHRLHALLGIHIV